MIENIGIENNYEIYMWIIIGLVIVVGVLCILSITTLSKLNKLQKKYTIFMKKDNVDLEELLIKYAKRVDDLSMSQSNTELSLKSLKEEVELCVKKVGVVRYKAIKDVGADLSFVVALLNGEDDGVVINGIYSRDGSYTYAKPIKSGKSTYKLSEEEEEALLIARNNK